MFVIKTKFTRRTLNVWPLKRKPTNHVKRNVNSTDEQYTV